MVCTLYLCCTINMTISYVLGPRGWWHALSNLSRITSLLYATAMKYPPMKNFSVNRKRKRWCAAPPHASRAAATQQRPWSAPGGGQTKPPDPRNHQNQKSRARAPHTRTKPNRTEPNRTEPNRTDTDTLAPPPPKRPRTYPHDHHSNAQTFEPRHGHPPTRLVAKVPPPPWQSCCCCL